MHWTGAEMAKAQRQEWAWHFEKTNSAQIREKERSENQVMKGLMCYVKLRCSSITPKATGPPNGFSCNVHGKMCSLEKPLWLQWDSWRWDESRSSVDYCDHRWEMTAAWPWTKAAGWSSEQWRGWTSPREQEQTGFSVRKRGVVAKSCPTLCDPMDDGPAGTSVYGISQARNWSVFSFSSLSEGSIPANSIMPTVPIWLGEGISQDMELPVKNQESSAQSRASSH